jgi:hypothetical protein
MGKKQEGKNGKKTGPGKNGKKTGMFFSPHACFFPHLLKLLSYKQKMKHLNFF